MTGPVAFSCLVPFTLGSRTLLLRVRAFGKPLPRCFGVTPRLLLEEFQLSLGDCARVVRTWKSLATLFAQYLAPHWIQVLRLFLEAFGRISSIFFVKVSSDPVVDSRPAFLGFFRFVQFGEVHSRCFDSVDCLSLWHFKTGRYPWTQNRSDWTKILLE